MRLSDWESSDLSHPLPLPGSGKAQVQYAATDAHVTLVCQQILLNFHNGAPNGVSRVVYRWDARIQGREQLKRQKLAVGSVVHIPGTAALNSNASIQLPPSPPDPDITSRPHLPDLR